MKKALGVSLAVGFVAAAACVAGFVCANQGFSENLESSIKRGLAQRDEPVSWVRCEGNEAYGDFKCLIEISPDSGVGMVYAVHRIENDCWEGISVEHEAIRPRSKQQALWPAWLPVTTQVEPEGELLKGCV